MKTKPTTGLVMSEADYSAIDALRSSEVKTAARLTLAHLAHSRTKTQEDTDAFLVGRALHCAVLRPDDFASEFLTAPNATDARRKAKHSTKQSSPPLALAESSTRHRRG